MDTGWIQVFVLILSECVAPAGKTICQEQELRYEFFDADDCTSVLEQLLDHKDGAANIIVNRDKSSCKSTARKQRIYRTLDEANEALTSSDGFDDIPVVSESLDFSQKAHNERLSSVPECADVAGVAPCKIGEIIVEGATENKTDVWRRDN